MERPIRSKLTPEERAKRKAARNAAYYDRNIEKLREKAREKSRLRYQRIKAPKTPKDEGSAELTETIT